MCGKCRESDLIMKIKTCELSGKALDFAVAKCIANVHEDAMLNGTTMSGWWVSNLFIDPNHWVRSDEFNPSTNWAQGGPIIERNDICLSSWYSKWEACASHGRCASRRTSGPTPLIAAMRVIVASKLGDEVEIPGELL